jgi:hypothetical protein
VTRHGQPTRSSYSAPLEFRDSRQHLSSPRTGPKRNGEPGRRAEITQTFRVASTNVDEDIAVATVDIVFAADRYELRYVMEIK